MDGSVGLVPKLSHGNKQRFARRMRRCKDADRARRYLIILNLLNARSVTETAQVVGVDRTTVYRVAQRYREHGEAGLLDRREDNGDQKLDERYLGMLNELVRSRPCAHGWPQPVWNRERLIETMRRKTGVRVHPATMSRALKQIGARRGRPRARVRCPWSKRLKNRRIRTIRRLAQRVPPRQVVVYADEVDIHLNPKIGLDWMGRGQQKQVMTPGQNVKRYLAGAKDAVSGRLTWVEGERKDSTLFIRLLHALRKRYPGATKIHVILDNYRIHSSKITKAVLRHLRGQIELHFLPPYCPGENKIERLWQGLHANVIRNHKCPDIESLMRQVRWTMELRDRQERASPRRAA